MFIEIYDTEREENMYLNINRIVYLMKNEEGEEGTVIGLNFQDEDGFHQYLIAKETYPTLRNKIEEATRSKITSI